MSAKVSVRKFTPLEYSSAIALAAFILFLAACSSAPHPQQSTPLTQPAQSSMSLTVEDLDYQQIIAAADIYLTQEPLTITTYPPPADGGGIHEYYSQAPYFWPNPKDPNGPYIRRDGYNNPNVFTAHFKVMNEMSVAVSTLTAAYIITHNPQYADKAIAWMRAWFIDPATQMAPNLQYAQVIKGVSEGRGTGIIDTHMLVKVARSAEILEQDDVLTGPDKTGVNKWFSEYLHWLTTSPHGKDEMNAKNNHGTFWLMQAAEFSRLVGDQTTFAFCQERFMKVLLPDQMAANGSFPLELARTKPFGYSLFNLNAMCVDCWILSTPGKNLFNYTTPNGRNMRLGLTFLYPYLVDQSKWPYKHDVEHWGAHSGREDCLLLGGLAYGIPEYVEFWKTGQPVSTNKTPWCDGIIGPTILWVH